MREIEIKFKVENLKALEDTLGDKGCILSAPIHQHDTVYSHKDRIEEEWKKPKEGDIVLRIRRQDNEVEFNLKQQCSHEMDNIEHETRIDDPETMHKMLLILGYAPVVEVKKIRRKGKLGEYEICLDEVEELGDFVELEKLADDEADPAKVEEDLFRTLESLGLSRTSQEKRGYDTQIFQLRHSQND